MTFNPSVPLNSDSPSIFPAQNQTNMSRIYTIIDKDHQFNLATATNDGYHKIIHMTIQAPSGGVSATGQSYAKTSAGRVHQFYMDDTGDEYQISPTMPIRASVNFDGTGAVGVQTIRSQFNVASVTKTGTGAYTVTFTTAMPDANYMVQVSGMRNVAGDVISGTILGSATYSDAVNTTRVKVKFFGSSDNARDVIMGNVTIFSAT